MKKTLYACIIITLVSSVELVCLNKPDEAKTHKIKDVVPGVSDPAANVQKTANNALSYYTRNILKIPEILYDLPKIVCDECKEIVGEISETACKCKKYAENAQSNVAHKAACAEFKKKTGIDLLQLESYLKRCKSLPVYPTNDSFINQMNPIE